MLYTVIIYLPKTYKQINKSSVMNYKNQK